MDQANKKPKINKNRKTPPVSKVETEAVITPLSTSSPLTLEFIAHEDEKYEELLKVTFANGMYTNVYKHFRLTKIDTLVEDFTAFSIEFQQIGRALTDKEILDYLCLHIIQHFSTISGEFPKDIHEKIDLYNKLLDSEYAENILEAFDEEQIAKVYTLMYKKFKTHAGISEQDVDSVGGIDGED
ncbi:MAG: hypothetical protein K0Q73_6207 [Paenibacillus sp.]|jgi:hypothetical protein|nr:hypothetical protein [Paenibacillus sp.]